VVAALPVQRWAAIERVRGWARLRHRSSGQHGITVKFCLRQLPARYQRSMLRGCWSYVLGELDTQSAAIKEPKLFATSSDGFMPYSDRPESLKRGLIARIPSAINLEDLP
jgi:predicted metal-binding protein